jgi:hypothetical protein
MHDMHCMYSVHVLSGANRCCQRVRERRLAAHEYMWQAKSVWRPSSREMSSLEKVRPGMRPRFFSQKMAQKLPLKKMPSTHANATRRCAKLRSLHACAGVFA